MRLDMRLAHGMGQTYMGLGVKRIDRAGRSSRQAAISQYLTTRKALARQ